MAEEPVLVMVNGVTKVLVSVAEGDMQADTV